MLRTERGKRLKKPTEKEGNLLAKSEKDLGEQTKKIREK